MGQAVRQHDSSLSGRLVASAHHCPILTMMPSSMLLRQRYQFRLKQLGEHSTLSNDREDLLNAVGFVWDSHQATWSDNFQTLKACFLANGHCCIPPPQLSKEEGSLNNWCKHQRRQYKRFQAGLDCTMTAERIRCLESIGFDWNPRHSDKK
jgi:hypothetical protein